MPEFHEVEMTRLVVALSEAYDSGKHETADMATLKREEIDMKRIDLPCGLGKIATLTGYANKMSTSQGIDMMVTKVREHSCAAIYMHNAEGFDHLVALSQYGSEHKNIIVVDAAKLVAHPMFVRDLKKWATEEQLFILHQATGMN